MKTLIGDLIEDCTTGIILHQVNCQGVMSKGIALQIKQKYPEVFTKYKKYCDSNKEFSTKTMLGTVQPVKVSDKLIVMNLFAQDTYANNHGETRRYTSYDALDECFHKIKMHAIRNNLPLDSLQHPMLGCGLGGADWSAVAALIDLHFEGKSNLWVLPKKEKT